MFVPNDFGIDFMSISYLARIFLVIQGLVDNFTFGEVSLLSQLRYLIIENIKFSVGIHIRIITWDVEMLVQPIKK